MHILKNKWKEIQVLYFLWVIDRNKLITFLILFYLALSLQGKGRCNRFPQLLQAHYCQFLWGRKTRVPGEKPSESDRDKQIFAHMWVQDSILDPQRWEMRMMTTTPTWLLYSMSDCKREWLLTSKGNRWLILLAMITVTNIKYRSSISPLSLFHHDSVIILIGCWMSACWCAMTGVL